jgi:hypothetical protein
LATRLVTVYEFFAGRELTPPVDTTDPNNYRHLFPYAKLCEVVRGMKGDPSYKIVATKMMFHEDGERILVGSKITIETAELNLGERIVSLLSANLEDAGYDHIDLPVKFDGGSA